MFGRAAQCGTGVHELFYCRIIAAWGLGQRTEFDSERRGRRPLLPWVASLAKAQPRALAALRDTVTARRCAFGHVAWPMGRKWYDGPPVGLGLCLSAGSPASSKVAPVRVPV